MAVFDPEGYRVRLAYADDLEGSGGMVIARVQDAALKSELVAFERSNPSHAPGDAFPG